jgi:phosphohistidine phosphatase
MQIYLLRHGIAEDARAGQGDSERALTGEGRDKLRRVLKRAKAGDASPDAILSSPYRRAVETAQVAVEVFGYTGEIVRTRALVPEASPQDVWDEIRALKIEGSILLASHEPLMSSTVAFFLACSELHVEMKKGALVRVDCERVGLHPRGVLRWMLTPAVS